MSDYFSPAPTPSPSQPNFGDRLVPNAQASGSRRTNHSRSPLITTDPLLSSSSKPPRAGYHSKPGCELCALVASATATSSGKTTSPTISFDSTFPSRTASPSLGSTLLGPQDRSSSPYHQPFDGPASRTAQYQDRQDVAPIVATGGRDILFQDDQITVYPATGKERLCSDGRHLIIVINQHAESVYDFGPVDVSLLSHIVDVGHALLAKAARRGGAGTDAELGRKSAEGQDVRIGFVGTVSRDPYSSHAHLHAHAMFGPMNSSLPGATFWRRNVVFGSMNWWSVEDLRAEIRESTSNNRVKSGYLDRPQAPIDRVPDAGSATGLPNALDPDPYSDVSPRPSAPIALPDTPTESYEMTRDPSNSSTATVRGTVKGKERDRTRDSSDSDGFMNIGLNGISDELRVPKRAA